MIIEVVDVAGMVVMIGEVEVLQRHMDLLLLKMMMMFLEREIDKLNSKRKGKKNSYKCNTHLICSIDPKPQLTCNFY